MLVQEGAIDRALKYADETEVETQRLLAGPDYIRLRCRVFGCLSTAIALAGQNDRLVRLARRSLFDARAAGHRFEAMRFLIMLASSIDVEDHDEAVLAGEEGLKLAKEFAVPSYLAWAPMMLAGRLAGADPSRAEALLVEAGRAAERADNRFAQSMAGLQLASVQSARRDYLSSALTLVDQAERASARGDHSIILQSLGSLVPVLLQLGEDDTALLIGAWIERLGARPYDETNPTFRRFHGDAFIARRDGLSDDERRDFSSRASDLDEAAVLGLARSVLQTREGSRPVASS
jgi:hypothetical protein